MPTSSTANQDFVEKNYRHNYVNNVLDGFTFWLGNSFYAPGIILPVFVTHFTSNPLILGLIPFIATAGYLVPQLFTSRWVESVPIKKIFPVNYGFFLERLPIALLVPATYFLAGKSPTWALIATLALFTWHTVGAGTILVGWQDMIAKVIPTDRRGRFFGFTNFLGAASGTAGALAVTWLLANTSFPMGYVWAFAVGATLNYLSWWFVSRTREPPDEAPKTTPSFGDYYRGIPHILQENRNFAHYLISQMIIAVSSMANGFLVIYAVQHWSLPDDRAAAFTVVYMIGQALANPLFGALADRQGHKVILEISLAVNIASLVLAVLSPDPLWFYLVFFLRGVNNAGSYLSGTSIVMEFGAPQNRPTLIGLANTLPGLTGGVAPLLAGWLAIYTGYPAVFVLAGVIGGAGLFCLHGLVKEPRRFSATPLAPMPKE
jgi:MFS family permease